MTPADPRALRAEADELSELRVLREHIAFQLDLPPDTPIQALAVIAGTKIRLAAADEALAQARLSRANHHQGN